jgi:hypothetical protein
MSKVFYIGLFIAACYNDIKWLGIFSIVCLFLEGKNETS